MSNKHLITGGAGFIGSNYVYRLLGREENVSIFDNLSRDGAELNLGWLKDTFGEDAFNLVKGDVRDAELLNYAAADADIIVHLAGEKRYCCCTCIAREPGIQRL